MYCYGISEKKKRKKWLKKPDRYNFRMTAWRKERQQQNIESEV